MTNIFKQNLVPEQWKIIIPEKIIHKALINLSETIANDYENKELLLVGVLTGAAYFTVDLSRRLNINHSINFIRSSSYKNSQISSDEVELTGLSEKDLSDLSHKHILVLDELYDSGRTLDEVVTYLKQFNPISINTCVMFRKHKKSSSELISPHAPQYCGIDNLPDVWYVGYGLDDCETKRDYMNLYAVPKNSNIPLGPDDIIFNSDEHLNNMINNIIIHQNN